MVDTHNGILLSQKKEHIWVSASDVDENSLLCRVMYVRKRKINIRYFCIYVESGKMVLMDLFAGQQWRHRHRQQTMDIGNRKARVGLMERVAWKHTNICKIDSQWVFVVWRKELKPGLCDNWRAGMGWWVGGRLKREGIYVYLWLIHIDVWQKQAPYCNYPSIKNKQIKGK